MTRYFAWATVAAASVFALVALLLLTTTTGYGCEDGCGRYERVLMWTGPILFLAFVVGSLVTAGLWLVKRHFAKPSYEERVRRVVMLIATFSLIGAILAGCGGQDNAASSAEASRADVAKTYVRWRGAISAAARADPHKRFPNLPRSTLLARLDVLSREYDFKVESVKFLQPKQYAPVVVIRAEDRYALAKAARAILKRIDPKRPHGDDRIGWTYEAFFFEAREENGTPFLAVFHNWRGPHAGGGQWASEDRLLPFEVLG